MSAVKNNSWNRSMLPQNFAESLKCYPYTQFIFLLCPYVIKARHPGETGGQATLRQRTCWARILTVEAFPSDRMRGQVTTVSLTPHAPGTPYHGAWNANSPPISSHAPKSTRLLCFEFHSHLCPSWSLQCSGLDLPSPPWPKVFTLFFQCPLQQISI